MFATRLFRVALAGLFASLLFPACTESFGKRTASEDAALNPSRSGAYNPFAYNDSYPNTEHAGSVDRNGALSAEDR